LKHQTKTNTPTVTPTSKHQTKTNTPTVTPTLKHKTKTVTPTPPHHQHPSATPTYRHYPSKTPKPHSASVAAPSVIGSLPGNQQMLASGPSLLNVYFNENVLNDGSNNAANNPAMYLLVERGTNGVFDTSTCRVGPSGDDLRVPISQASYSNFFGLGPYKTTLKLNSSLAPGTYRLFVCGTTSIENLDGVELNGGRDSVVTFTVSAASARSDFWTSFSSAKLIDLLFRRIEGLL
jgi:hypothetical protein